MAPDQGGDTSAVEDGGESIPALIEEYERTALRSAELEPDPSAANAVFDENHAIYKRLRGHEEGRRGIAQLMRHDSVAVRLAAATHCLAWEPDAATSVLEAIERLGGLQAVTAKWTLRSFRSGKLDLDW